MIMSTLTNILKSPFVYLKYKFLFKFAEYQTSTPKKIIRELEKRKITSLEIKPEHLLQTYKQQWSWQDSPKTVSANEMFSFLSLNTKIVKDKCWGVIIETREHPHLSYVIDNFIQLTGLSVQLYHGTKNIDFILSSKINQHIKDGKVILTDLKVDNLDAAHYNALFLTKSFWQSIHGRNKVLVFQTDSDICAQSDYTLDHFMDFDYIGSRWSLRRRRNGLILDGGVGGLSLRDYKKSLESVIRFPVNSLWEGGEDDFFAFHIELIGGKVGDDVACDQFCSQKRFNANSFGFHSLNDMDSETLSKFLQYCPQAKRMVNKE